MAKILKPRRGSSSTMNSTKGNTVLAAGEIFFETPNSGVGTAEGAGIKMGDGVTAYSNLPYFIKPTNVSTSAITITADNSSTSTAALNNVASSATTGALIGSLKQAISLTKSELTSTIDDNIYSKLSTNGTSSGTQFYFDYQNGEYGYNTSSTRGADTFIPFKSASTLTATAFASGNTIPAKKGDIVVVYIEQAYSGNVTYTNGEKLSRVSIQNGTGSTWTWVESVLCTADTITVVKGGSANPSTKYIIISAS